MTQSNQWYLGKVDYDPTPHTRISCLAVAKNGAWIKEDLIKVLPPLGKVFAVSRSLSDLRRYSINSSSFNSIKEGCVLAVAPSKNVESGNTEKEHDHYLISNTSDVTIPRIVLDFRNKTMEQIRYELVQRGIDGFGNIISEFEEIIVAINNEQCLVLDLQKHPDPANGRYITNTGLKEIFEFDNRIFEGDKINGLFCEIPNITVGEFLDDIEWKLDQDILKNLLKQLRPFNEHGLPSKNEVERIIPILNRSLDLLNEYKGWDNEKEWLQAYTLRAKKSIEIPRSLVRQLANLEPVHRQLDEIKLEIKNSYYDELKTTARTEIESEMQNVVKEIADKDETLVRLNQELESLSKKTNELREIIAEQEQWVSTLQNEAQEAENWKNTFQQSYKYENNQLKELVETNQALQQEIQKKQESCSALETKEIELSEFLETFEVDKILLEENLERLKKQLISEINALNQVLGKIDDLEKTENKELIARLQQALKESGRLLAPLDSSTPPWSQTIINDYVNISYNDLASALNRKAKKYKIPEDVFSLFDVALRSGVLTILPQNLAEILIPKYAQIIAAGQFYREPLGPNILNLEDIWVQPNRGVKTGFAKAWLNAINDSESYQIVWLDGINRTAMDLWLPSLIGVMNNNRAKNLLVVASIDDAFVENERTWQNLPTYCLPIYEDLKSLRLSSLMKDLTGESEHLTKLNYRAFEQPIDWAEYQDEIDKDNLTQSQLEIELKLYLAQNLGDSNSSFNNLKKYDLLRTQGRNWLSALLEK